MKRSEILEQRRLRYVDLMMGVFGLDAPAAADLADALYGNEIRVYRYLETQR